jgi:hypothetical protein
MTDLKKAAQQALEALKLAIGVLSDEDETESNAVRASIKAIKTALAEPVQEPDYWQEEARRYAGNADYWRKRALEQPEQEPVAWACFKNGELQTELVGTEADVDFWCASDEPEMQGMVKGALYTNPPRREWRSLSEEEIAKCWHDTPWNADLKTRVFAFARAVEAALKEKNHE